MPMKLEEQIFRKGSKTYFFSAQFFPRKIREDAGRLYSFVRVADDFVDQVPAQSDKFYALRAVWDAAKEDFSFFTHRLASDSVEQRVIKNIVFLMRTYNFDPAWIESFLNSMQSDLMWQGRPLTHKTYETLDDVLHYVHGSAEVVGLMMARIMGLPDESLQYAKLQGRAMQFLNFIRDIQEDIQLGRCYFPREDLKQFNLKDLTFATATAQPTDFINFMNFQLNRYYNWQAEAIRGHKYISNRRRIALQTAIERYNKTAQAITLDPLVVFAPRTKQQKSSSVAHSLKFAVDTL